MLHVTKTEVDRAVAVVCRFRPPTQREVQLNSDVKRSYFISPNMKTVHVNQHAYTLSFIYGEETSQETIYKDCVEKVVQGLFKGFNGCIMGYGMTAGGKTYTMEGIKDDLEREGLIPRVARDIFRIINESTNDLSFEVKVSHIEIYNEQFNDLLSPKTHLRLREKSGGFYLEGLNQFQANTPESMISLLNHGSRNRVIGETKMNARSSRSHAIFAITLTTTNNQNLERFWGTLSLVDLAGSERVSKTGAQGVTLREAMGINRSLLTLKQVIRSFTKKNERAPYRESSLTKILKNSIGGNSRTVLILACSPVETESTLQFGTEARLIVNKVTANIQKSPEQLRMELAIAQQEIERLKALPGSQIGEIGVPNGETITIELAQWKTLVKSERQNDEYLRRCDRLSRLLAKFYYNYETLLRAINEFHHTTESEEYRALLDENIRLRTELSTQQSMSSGPSPLSIRKSIISPELPQAVRRQSSTAAPSSARILDSFRKKTDHARRSILSTFGVHRPSLDVAELEEVDVKQENDLLKKRNKDLEEQLGSSLRLVKQPDQSGSRALALNKPSDTVAKLIDSFTQQLSQSKSRYESSMRQQQDLQERRQEILHLRADLERSNMRLMEMESANSSESSLQERYLQLAFAQLPPPSRIASQDSLIQRLQAQLQQRVASSDSAATPSYHFVQQSMPEMPSDYSPPVDTIPVRPSIRGGRITTNSRLNI